MNSSLVLQQCPACLVRLTWIVFMMESRWPYNWCFVGVLPPGLVQNCSQHSCEVAVKLFLHTFSVHVVHPYSSFETTTAWKKLRFILSVRSDFHMIDSLWTAVHPKPVDIQLRIDMPLKSINKSIRHQEFELSRFFLFQCRQIRTVRHFRLSIF